MLLSVLRSIVARDSIHLLYHSISAEPLPYVTPLYGCKSPAEFERDLVYLKTHFNPVSHAELVRHREQGTGLPPNAVTVSFDDGFAECYSLARPLLLAHGIPAAFFVCRSFVDNGGLMHRNKVALCASRIAAATPPQLAAWLDKLGKLLNIPAASPASLTKWLMGLGYPDSASIDSACECLDIDVPAFLRERRPYMTRGQVAELHSDGFTIGGHTMDHPELGALPGWNPVRNQIAGSCEFVRTITGAPRVPFAFPFSGRNLPRPNLAALCRESGIDLMYDTSDLMKEEPFIVNRICCDNPRGTLGVGPDLSQVIRRAYTLEPARIIKRGLLRRPMYEMAQAHR